MSDGCDQMRPKICLPSIATYIKKAWLQITTTTTGQLMAFEIEARSIRSQENCPCTKEGPAPNCCRRFLQGEIGTTDRYQEKKMIDLIGHAVIVVRERIGHCQH